MSLQPPQARSLLWTGPSEGSAFRAELRLEATPPESEAESVVSA